MKRLLLCLLASSFAIPHSSFSAEPLRVFNRAGKKPHGPGAHDFPQFLKEWVRLLNERGAKADGSLEFPTKEQLDKTDVLILHLQGAGNINIGPDRKNLTRNRGHPPTFPDLWVATPPESGCLRFLAVVGSRWSVVGGR